MPANKPQPSFEILAREKKAARLADTLWQYGITPAEAESASEDDWKLAALVARVNPPSADTIKIVIAMLEEREATK